MKNLTVENQAHRKRQRRARKHKRSPGRVFYCAHHHGGRPYVRGQ